MKDQNCAYFMREERGELLDAFGVFICELSVSSLILFKEQSHPGRCIVAYRDHVGELTDLTEEERNSDVCSSDLQAGDPLPGGVRGHGRPHPRRPVTRSGPAARGIGPPAGP